MSSPNIVISAIHGKTAVLVVTTSPTAILSNAGGSGKVLKVNSVIAANIDGTNPCTVNCDLYRSSTAYGICKAVTVTAGSAFAPITKETPIYLEEGDAIRLTAQNNSDIEAICSYEEIG